MRMRERLGALGDVVRFDGKSAGRNTVEGLAVVAVAPLEYSPAPRRRATRDGSLQLSGPASMNFTELKSLLVLPAALVVLAGCASSPPDQTADANTRVCRSAVPLGSNIPTVTCVSAEEAEEARRRNDPSLTRGIVPNRAGGGGG